MRVQTSIKALGYVYHRPAASLRSERTHTIGLLVTDVSNPFFAEMTTSVEAEVSAAGFVILLGHNYESVHKQARWIRVMLEYGVDGVIICPAHGTEPDMLRPLASSDIPHLLLSRYVEGYEASYVGADNVLGARLATDHLLDHGCRRITFLGGPEASSARRDRQSGVAQALADRGEDPAVPSLPTAASRQGGYQAAAQLLATSDPPDGIICYNDIVAFGVLAAARDLGVRVGSDMRVIGFDDIGESGVQFPSLTSVAVVPPTLGQRAARLLRQLIEDKRSGPRVEVAQPKLAFRASCGC
jgi:LacI family transcriptional regulator